MVDVNLISVTFFIKFKLIKLFLLSSIVPCRQPLRLAEVMNHLIYD